MAEIKCSEKVIQKLKEKHSVAISEVSECFKNRLPEHIFLYDTREMHKTDPATLWFIAETNKGRALKVCFVPPHAGNQHTVEIKSAFDPNEKEINIYEKHGKK
ncbi:hypothetical protein [Pseudomonas sp. B21-021]|uniref:hypothetical protein n=1 Tax=unclassified Pseudomonas TaxID=196821 RepID=UPI00215E0933|nr:hypothetical protein [Pseudomonas sp. B21-021]UVM27255.1 hypothetical protein LOY31_28175 [Pseudomonas sp. B21-021]